MQQSLMTTNMATIVNSICSEQYGHKRYSLIALIKYDEVGQAPSHTRGVRVRRYLLLLFLKK